MEFRRSAVVSGSGRVRSAELRSRVFSCIFLAGKRGVFTDSLTSCGSEWTRM